MPDASTKEAFRLAKRRCKRFMQLAFLVLGTLMLAGLAAQAGLAFVWLTEDTLVHVLVIVFIGALLLLAVFAPRCPNCGRRIPQMGFEGERNVGLDADACPGCFHSLPK